jgi:hypothetical protein
MIRYITADTLANTVRMGARTRRPKAVYLASDMADIELLKGLSSEHAYRVILAHSRQTAVRTFELLLESGYEGVFTAIDTQFAPVSESSPLDKAESASNEIVGIEGLWDDVKNQGVILSGHLVRVTFVENSGGPENGDRPPNTAMLLALRELEEIRRGMNPKRDEKDYLREAREGGTYGFGAE